MSDLVAEGMRAVAGGSVWSAPLVFAAGAVTSIGPCVAPRYVAVAAVAADANRPLRIAALFAAGVVGAYVALGATLGAIGTLSAWSTPAYATLAGALAVTGAIALWREPRTCRGEHPVRSAGGTFLLGAMSALVASPCCTPVIGAIAGITIASGRALVGASLLACFALGHVVPVFFVAATGRVSASLPARFAPRRATAVVGGTLMLALGAFYGLLA